MRHSSSSWWIAAAVILTVPGAALLADGRGRGAAAYDSGEPEQAPRPVIVVDPGERAAYLGVQLEEETDNPEGGARITEVVDGSPAAKAGLEVNDIVIEFAGATVRGPIGLTKQIHAKSPGDAVTIKVVRDGRERTFEAELGDRGERAYRYSYSLAPLERLQAIAPEIDDELREKIENGLKQVEVPQVWGLGSCGEGEDCGFRLLWAGRPRLGVELVETTPELKRHLGSTDDAGVLVGKVLRGMPAEHAGVVVGDLIVRVGDDPVKDVASLRSALAERAGETFKIRVIRDKKPVDVEVTLPEDEGDSSVGPQACLRGVAPPRPPRPTAPAASRAAPPVGPAPPIDAPESPRPDAPRPAPTPRTGALAAPPAVSAPPPPADPPAAPEASPSAPPVAPPPVSHGVPRIVRRSPDADGHGQVAPS